EKHIEIDENPISASLFDFGLYFFHNAKERINRGSGPYFYLPKLESHIEARLWNDVFNYAQDALNIPKGSIRATVLIETLPAAFEMEEILYELREHASGLNAGRWDYIFSAIKRLRNRNNTLLPDRDQVTMTVPFMRAYTKLLVKSCHQHGAHAMGGMAAFIPNRKDPTVTEKALAKVLEDKMREANDGFDGTWVAHPDLVAVARQAFDKKLADKPNQIQRLRDDVQVDATQLTDLRIPNAKITQVGMRHNISVAIQYINQWLSGTGAVALYNLMEDAATAEICRAQLWQWINQQATFADGVEITKTIYQKMADEVVAELKNLNLNYLDTSRKLLDDLVLTERFIEFLTIPAYEKLISLHAD
ncbi:MAG: malate synthase A, partial [Pseudomonadota bacterium]